MPYTEREPNWQVGDYFSPGVGGRIDRIVVVQISTLKYEVEFINEFDEVVHTMPLVVNVAAVKKGKGKIPTKKSSSRVRTK